ncbi:cardioacceleratory peptide receptor-like protein [Dinothrombium tinctorium]|uniref:Cardioacceleratory peptide receptor-like protein n=1 Tax=Dinothrombium tinctorium TaxID=1965070 RepID=A0A3S3PDP7_9ACAR|nr:cardioacceleratory peptide receptor-like protein [Dinothrombium tinctorium]
MTLVIVFVFILCYSPYFVWDLLQVYGFIPYTQTTIALSTFIQSLAPLNSAANPLIYCLFSTRFSRDPNRKRLIRVWIIKKICCCVPRLQQAYGRETFRTDFSGTLTSQTSSSRTTQKWARSTTARSFTLNHELN